MCIFFSSLFSLFFLLFALASYSQSSHERNEWIFCLQRGGTKEKPSARRIFVTLKVWSNEFSMHGIKQFVQFVHSTHERTASLILFTCHFFHKDFSVRTVDTTSTFPVYFFSNSLFIKRLFFSLNFSLNHLQTFLADSVCRSLRLYVI